MDFLLIIAIIAVIALIAALFVQQSKTKAVIHSVEKDRKALIEKEKLLLKEAKIKAIEELQDDREKLNEEERERRQELARQEQKLAKREDMLEDKIQEYTEKDLQAQRKIDELLEKEDYLAEIVQKQTTELERISGMSAEDAKTMLLEQLKHDLAQEQMQLIRENEAKIKETSLEKAKEIDDNNKLIYYNIASIYGDLGDKKLALENIDKALSIDNDYNDAIKLKEYINNLD